jgi:hypothetical protein
MIYGTLSLSTRVKAHKKIMVSALMAVFPAVVGSGLPMLAEDHENWSARAHVERVNQPPSLFFRQPTSLRAHIENSEALFTQLDRQVEMSRGDEIYFPPSEIGASVNILVSDADR